MGEGQKPMETRDQEPMAEASKRIDPCRICRIGKKLYPAWTDSMVEAIGHYQATGMKWFRLIDKVWDQGALLWAFNQVAANRGAAGCDRETIEEYGTNLEWHLKEVSRLLQQGRYQPQPVRRCYIPKGKRAQRPLGIPTVRDRVVQTALVNVLEPIFEHKFLGCSYGYRPGRSAHQALDAVSEALSEGRVWVVEVDIKSLFDHIPHEGLMREVKKEITDIHVLELIEGYLKAGIMEAGEIRDSVEGTPQGGVLSPLLANIYLHRLDEALMRKGCWLVRYADDMVLLCETQQEAEEVLRELREVLADMELELNEEKSQIVDSREQGFNFLGYTFYGPWRFPSDKSMKRVKEKVRRLTRRTRPLNVEQVILDVNPLLRGWAHYFVRGHAKSRFREIDEWVRMRLRSFLLKKKAHGWHNQWYPIDYFRTLMLFDLSRYLAHFHSLPRGNAV